MKSIGLSTLLIGAFAALISIAPSASAQDVSELSREQQNNMRPGIRYTTGSVTYAGWEKSLTDGDPNLRRWNWSAMTAYTQSCYNKVAPGAFVKKNKPNETQALKPAGGIYVKPIQVNPDTYAKRREQPGVIVVGTATGSGNVSGRVRLPKPQIAAAPPAAKSYNVNYVSGTLTVPNGEQIATRNVHGKLMNRL